MSQTYPAAQFEEESAFQCRHVHPDGRRCGSPCLRHEPFCYFHHTTRRPVEDATVRKARLGTFALPGPAELSDRAGIQLALAQVLERVASNDLDPRRAGTLLYGLQIALMCLPKQYAPARPGNYRSIGRIEPPSEPVYVEDVVHDPDLGVLAPEATMEDLTPKSTTQRLLEMFGEDGPDDDPTPGSAPRIQAVAASSPRSRRGSPGSASTLVTMPNVSSSLQAQLDKITTDTRALVPPEKLAITDNAVQDLLATGIEDSILPVGAAAPAFELQDALTQKQVASADLLALGPLVVNFFRGRWCPYCMTELETWQRLYPALRERGAMLVAISPQLLRQNDFTVQQHNIAFPVLSDPGAAVAAAFGAAYTVPPALRAHYRSILINIPFMNGTQPNDPTGDASWRLPVPATFVIRPSGTIAFAQAFADHRVRPEPQDVLAVL